MRAALLLLLFVALVTIKTVSGRKIKKDKTKPAQSGSECTDWRYGNCVPSNGDCGAGFREGSCDQQTKRMKCRVPCNWKKEFGADCKYRFGSWGECNPSSGQRTRTGTLRVALHNADCQETVFHNKPCPGKTKTKTETTKTKTKGKKRKGKAN
ncbi:midkine-B-like [Mastacembelus armatus]|uniref:Midkine n=1 Tax=Mastacembelus armatus TaxID=205130 RepID=A0A3Q3L533_9TELE|nr:midkine-B-like [Mastacembelus armatus]